MARVLVTEKLAERGLKLLAEAGHDVDVQLELSPEALLGASPAPTPSSCARPPR